MLLLSFSERILIYLSGKLSNLSARAKIFATEKGIGLKVLTGRGAAIDTTTAAGKLVFGIFAALAARARGRNGGRPYKMTPAKLRLAMAAMGQPGTKVGDLCQELNITRQTLYRHVAPNGSLRPDGKKLLERKRA